MGVAGVANAQVGIWFNGLGASVGAGAAHFRGEPADPLLSFVRPEDDRNGAVSAGGFLALGTSRWAIMLPEFHAFAPVSSRGRDQEAVLRVGARTLSFDARRQSLHAYAVLVGGQVAPLPSGRLWVRGGIGQGWLGGSVADSGEDVSVSVAAPAGLALSGAVGVRMWRRTLADGGMMSLDTEFHYLHIRSDALQIAAPSVRIGWSLVPFRSTGSSGSRGAQ